MLGTSRQSMLSLGSAVFSLSRDLQVVLGAVKTTRHVKLQYACETSVYSTNIAQIHAHQAVKDCIPALRLCHVLCSLAGLCSGTGEDGRPLVLAVVLVSCLSTSCV